MSRLDRGSLKRKIVREKIVIASQFHHSPSSDYKLIKRVFLFGLSSLDWREEKIVFDNVGRERQRNAIQYLPFIIELKIMLFKVDNFLF